MNHDTRVPAQGQPTAGIALALIIVLAPSAFSAPSEV